MLLCKVHNLVTDQRYEFQAADQAEIDARLLRKAATYGRDVWTETIPAWVEEVQDAAFLDAYRAWKDNAEVGDEPEPEVIEHPETTVEHAAERVVEIIDLAPQELQARLDAVYVAYQKAEIANITAAGAVQLAEWCQAGNTRALDVRAWLLALYAERDAKLTAIEAGDLTVDPRPSQPWKPWSFREIPKA